MLYAKEHLGCRNYESSEHPAIEVKKMGKHADSSLYSTQNKLFLLMEGFVEVDMAMKQKKQVAKGSFWFAATGQSLKIHAIEKALLLVIRINGSLALCNMYAIEKLHNEFKNNGGELKVDENDLYAATICPSLWHCIKGLFISIADGMRCRFFFEIKTKEIFFLLRAYYPKEELYNIFYPALTSDLVFSDTVKRLWVKHQRINDLATAMNYTYSGFYKRFVAVFGLTPREWFQKQRELAVYNDLMASEMSLKHIADKWGFSSRQSLSNYCKRIYRQSPKQIYNIHTSSRKLTMAPRLAPPVKLFVASTHPETPGSGR